MRRLSRVGSIVLGLVRAKQKLPDGLVPEEPEEEVVEEPVAAEETVIVEPVEEEKTDVHDEL